MKYDLSIYGFGPASIFFIHELINTKLKIAIHEIGDYDSFGKINNIDKLTGPFFFGNKERVKSVFGTASLWKEKGVGGHLFYFDKEDLKKWPIKYSELYKKYGEIIKKIEICIKENISSDYEKKNILDKINLSNLEKSFNLKMGSGSLKYNFLKLYQKLIEDIKKSENITIFTKSKLVKFNYDFKKKKILNSIVHQGKKKNFFSNFHILACGCLENNRIILQTFKKEKKYIKKYNIGKFISFHPSLQLGTIKLKKETYIDSNYFNKKMILLKPKKYNYMNTGLSFSINYFTRSSIIHKIIGRLRKKINFINVSLLIEHKTNQKNFINLSKKKYTNDDFKMNINTFFDYKNLIYIKKISKNFTKLLKNQKEFTFVEKKGNIFFETGNHHHGGLCFGKNKKTPVDENLKLKGFENLYICGSSLFPSSSCYGPTLTIMAISSLLGDRIKKKFNA
tara:strand:- start:2235 stop:3587 length:1353 start_codon:yes stop_codon:yes gene_type:complete